MYCLSVLSVSSCCATLTTADLKVLTHCCFLHLHLLMCDKSHFLFNFTLDPTVFYCIYNSSLASVSLCLSFPILFARYQH